MEPLLLTCLAPGTGVHSFSGSCNTIIVGGSRLPSPLCTVSHPNHDVRPNVAASRMCTVGHPSNMSRPDVAASP